VLLGAFALLAVVLASIGLYGVLAYAVAERTKEIGVRMALGAGAYEILRDVGARGLALTIAGLAIGLVLGFAGTRAMRTLFYELPPDYLSAAAAAAAILLAVAAVACFIPARRASHIDPIKALQQE
jgi:ABC-type antimicrobial peptide transport system permease subunit